MEPELEVEKCQHCVDSAAYLLKTYYPYLDAIGMADDTLTGWDCFLWAGKIMKHGNLAELRNLNAQERTALREKLTRGPGIKAA